MAEEKVVDVEREVYQQRKWGGRKKTLAWVVLIIVLATLAFYLISWSTSDVGRQKIADLRYAVSTKYNPFYWYGEQLKKGQEIGRIWQTESNQTAEKVGAKFQSFESIGTRILPAGATLAFKYKLEVGEGVKDLKITPKCKITAKDLDGIEVTEDIKKSEPVIIPEAPKVSTDDPLSYANILCQVETKEDVDQDVTVTAEGKISFTQPRQRNSLRVYFTKDTENIGNKFFEVYGIAEKLPIKSTYSNEPVEIGIGVSDENIQPVIIEERYLPSIGISLSNRWDGRVTLIKEMNLYLPKEVTIDETKSPTSTLCPFKTATPSGTNYIKYESDENYLKKLEPFGRGVKETLLTYQRFFCWLNVNEDILGGAEYTQDQYSVDVTYEYEFQPKSVTVTLKGIKKGEETTTKVTYYACQDKTTKKYSCVTKCTENCEPDCSSYKFENKDECEEHIKDYLT